MPVGEMGPGGIPDRGAALRVFCQYILLGSIGTDKYTRTLLDVFGKHLFFPEEFVGCGDMSRGGLMLRCALSGEELSYVTVEGEVRRGARPPKLTPLRKR